MKIRMKGNSIRLRLSKSEVQKLSDKNTVEETVEIGSSKFQYAISSCEIDHVEARFFDNTIQVYLPMAFASSWFENEEVGIQYIQKNENGSELLLLIEKDFICLDKTFEDQSDNFTNPGANC